MTNEPKKKKSLLRRILKWTGITFLLLIILVIAAPFLFKKQIVQFVKDTANEQLNAKVNFGEFDLTLISSFPDFTLSVDSVSVANIGKELIKVKSNSPKFTFAFNCSLAVSFTNCTICFLNKKGAAITKMINNKK